MKEKREKFLCFAEQRVYRAPNDIRISGNFSNYSTYSFTDVDAKIMLMVIQKELDNSRAHFGDAENAPDGDLKL